MTDFHDDPSNPDLNGERPNAIKHSYFDFVIAERPVYIPNSGPPSQPISIMPPHDKVMLIEAEIQLGSNSGGWVYQVCDPSKPGLRVSVRPQNILDWVSQRTLEKWELEGPDRRQREQEEFIREQEAERNVKRLKATKSRATNGIPKRVARKRHNIEIEPHSKRRLSSNAAVTAALAGPARKRKSVVEEEPVFTSPTTTHKRPKGPSLTTPVKNNEPDTDTADEADLDDDDDDEDAAIERQLNGLRTYGPFKTPLHRPRSSVASTPKRAGSTPKRTASTPKGDAFTPKRDASASKRAPAIPASVSRNQPGKSPLFSPRYPVATSSSLVFRKEYEKLEKEKGTRVSSVEHSIRDKYPFVPPSMFKATSKRDAALKHIQNPFTKKAVEEEEEEEEEGEELTSDDAIVVKELRPKKAAVEDEEEEEKDQELSGIEWEVEAILDEDETLLDDHGIPRLHYLIKWAAAPGTEWDNSWEPEEHVAADAVAEFRLKQKKKQREESKSTQQPTPKPKNKNPAPILPPQKSKPAASTPRSNTKSSSRTPGPNSRQPKTPVTNSQASSKALGAKSRSQSKTPTATNQPHRYKAPPKSAFVRDDDDDEEDEDEPESYQRKRTHLAMESAFKTRKGPISISSSSSSDDSDPF